MLRQLIARHHSFALSTPFRIARGTKTASEVVTVVLRQDGCEGRGEAVPYARYGETIAGTLASIEDTRVQVEAGCDRATLAALLPAGAARNALDCALWDLEAKLRGTSVAQSLGRPEPVDTVSAITIGIDTPGAMREAAARHAEVPLLKIKLDRSQIRERIAAIRSAAPRPRLIVDPNESWTIDELRDLQGFLVDHRVDLLEQPLPADDDAALADFRSRVPICADEAVHIAADLPGLAGKYDVVNIKLDKTGGLTEALRLADQARAQGFGLMIGCMVCSSLGIAPALQLVRDAAFVDLDGPLWLASDHLGGVTDRNGILSPPAPGFWGDAVRTRDRHGSPSASTPEPRTD